MTYAPFSVAMSVYGKDNADWFAKALASIVEQTVKPAEIVLVEDGPVSQEIEQVVAHYQQRCKEENIAFNLIPLPQNQGLGNALRLATESATHELVARMDSDDISVPFRFEHQLAFFAQNPETSILGGNIEEFVGEPSNIVGQRVCPQTDADIRQYMKKRCAMNHVSVMFRKSEVLRAGNYMDWFYNEDYYLWIRMMLAGCTFANLDEVLVTVRMGYDTYGRRGGMRYFRSERDIQRLMFKEGIISRPAMVTNICIRFGVQILLPNWLRSFVFQKLFRKN